MNQQREWGEVEPITRRQGCAMLLVLILGAIGWMVVENNAAPRRMAVLQAELRAHGVAEARAYPVGQGRCDRHQVDYVWKASGREGRACATGRQARLLPD